MKHIIATVIGVGVVVTILPAVVGVAVTVPAVTIKILEKVLPKKEES